MASINDFFWQAESHRLAANRVRAAKRHRDMAVFLLGRAAYELQNAVDENPGNTELDSDKALEQVRSLSNALQALEFVMPLEELSADQGGDA